MSDTPSLKLPFWMEGAETGALAAAAREWFSRLGQAATLPARQLDPLTCSGDVLDLLAWQRNVTRYKGEPERAYRLRVAHAYANARDAGGGAGWRRIFQRLEVGAVTLEERIGGQDWDVVGVVLSDDDQSNHQSLVEIIIEEYGRTCRRYTIVARAHESASVCAGAFDNDHSTHEATLPQDFTAIFTPRPVYFFHNNDHATVELELPTQFTAGISTTAETFANDYNTVEATWQ